MTVTVKQFPGEPIVVQTMSPDYQLQVEFPQDYPKLYALLDQQPRPVFWVVDISAIIGLTFEDLLKGTEIVARGDKALYRHRNIREVLYVSTEKMIKMAAAGLKADTFGNIKVLVFESLDAALQYARKQL